MILYKCDRCNGTGYASTTPKIDQFDVRFNECQKCRTPIRSKPMMSGFCAECEADLRQELAQRPPFGGEKMR